MKCDKASVSQLTGISTILQRAVPKKTKKKTVCLIFIIIIPTSTLPHFFFIRFGKYHARK